MISYINYLVAHGYGRIFSGGNAIEIIQCFVITASINSSGMCDYVTCTYRREQTVKELAGGVNQSNGLVPINFSWADTTGKIIQDCGSLDAFKDCDKVAVGICGKDYFILYDINTRVFGKVSKSDIWRNQYKIQNMTRGSATAKVKGGVDRLIKFDPNCEITFRT